MDENRISRLEGSYDALKVVRPMTITVIGIFLAALVFVLSFLSAQIVATNNKVDTMQARLDAQTAGINAQLSAEFRAMRAEMSAQTSAIANSITAARQMQTVTPAPATAR